MGMKHGKILVRSISNDLNPTTEAPSAGPNGELGRLALESDLNTLENQVDLNTTNIAALSAAATSGSVDTSDFVTLSTVQTISAQKDFQEGLTVNSRLPKMSNVIGSRLKEANFAGPKIQTLSDTPSGAATLLSSGDYTILDDVYYRAGGWFTEGDDGYLYIGGASNNDSDDYILKVNPELIKVESATNISSIFSGGFVDVPGVYCPRDSRYYFVYDDGVNGRIGAIERDGTLSSIDVTINSSNQVDIRSAIYCPTSGLIFFISKRQSPTPGLNGWLYTYDPVTQTVNQKQIYWDGYSLSYDPVRDQVMATGHVGGWFSGPLEVGLPNFSGTFSWVITFDNVGNIIDVYSDSVSNYFYACYCPINEYLYIPVLTDPTIHIFNPVTYEVDDTITVPTSNPEFARFNPANGYLYVNDPFALVEYVIDPVSNKVINQYDSIYYYKTYSSTIESMFAGINLTSGSDTVTSIQIF
jgi:hypothetical protein